MVKYNKRLHYWKRAAIISLSCLCWISCSNSTQVSTFYKQEYIEQLVQAEEIEYLARKILDVNPDLTDELHCFIAEEIYKTSQIERVNQYLILSVMIQESQIDPEAKSTTGPRGLMQLAKRTAIKMAEGIEEINIEKERDIYHIPNNIRLGTRYLSYLLERYPLKKALQGYYAGEQTLSEDPQAGLFYRDKVLKIYLSILRERYNELTQPSQSLTSSP